MANGWGNNGNSERLNFLRGSKVIVHVDSSCETERRLLLRRKAVTNLNSVLKNRDITLLKGTSSQNYGFSSSHVRMWELDSKESWVLKSWCFWTVVLEKTLESPLDCKETQQVNSKGNQPWIFIGRTDAAAETPILWPPDAKSWLIGRSWCWKRLKAEGEGDNRERDG